jgi:type IV pilus assembly protein PilY1
MKTQLRIMQFWLGFSCLAAWTCAQAAPLSLANAPLFLGTSVDANVFFELDDSGSMDWETLTNEFDYHTNYWDPSNDVTAKVDHGMWESTCSSGSGFSCGSFTGKKSYGYIFPNTDRLYQTTDQYGSVALSNPESYQRDWRVFSADFNLVYYNPTVTYQPWTPDMPNAVFADARSNPQSGSTGYSQKRNLAGTVFEVWIDDHGYSGSRPDGTTTATNTPNGIVDLWDSRVRYTINATSMTATTYTTASNIATINSGSPRNCTVSEARATVPYFTCYGTTASTTTYGTNDINPWGRTLAEEQQNVANWYSYARKRQYAAKAAIAAVVANSTGFRYGLSVINGGIFVQVPGSAVTNYASHNTSMLNSLFSYTWGANGTPLRAGLENVGKYFDGELSGKTDPIYSQCQQNFTLLLTDGYWSGDSVANAIGDADGDGRSKTVADVARYYYNKDLSSLANTVPTSVIDPNNKQHLVTFTVAFGVRGDLVDTDNDGYPNPVLRENDRWGDDPTNDANNAGKIDDLWHAAFNSKGQFVSARTPAEMVEALEESLSEISDRVGSSASVATNSGQLNAGSHVFQARFDSGEWSGQLIAFAINADGTLRPNPSWDAARVLDGQNYSSGRTILTWNPQIDIPAGGAVEGRGVPFRFPSAYQSPNGSTDIGTAQLQQLMKYAPNTYNTNNSTQRTANQNYGSALLNYLRGHRANEGSGTYAFRARNAVLGDIVDSDPQYVGPPRFRYPDNLQSAPYSTFAAANAARTPMVYVGANDGMLHGFQESNGQEKLAYIPNEVFANLPELSRTTYTHMHYVNEAPTIVDAWLPSYNGTGAWRTMLVGGLGRGGQGIYALDVTDPSTFSENNANSIVKWEFTDADSPDLGYTYSQISIAKMANGKWAAVFGNGYNNTEADGAASTTGYASLYIVDIETGALIRKIDTNIGSAATPNGLSSPALVDANQDFIVDYIYAGDLRGNMWKFDVTSNNAANWKVAYAQSGNPKPLFTTAGGANQPITTRPVLTSHPTGRDGFMVYFGTGKYIENGDNDPTGASTQAFYGIWDKNLATHTTFTAASNLVQQFITNQRSVDFNEPGEDDDDKRHVVRDVSSNAVDYSTKLGWYIELKPQKVNGSANASNFGEKQVTNALVRNGRVIFTTLLPSQNQCDFGGTSFTMQLDFKNGGLLGDPPFDLNGDDTFDSNDTYVGGVQSKVGIIPTLSVIADGAQEIAFGSGSSGDVESMKLNPGANAVGRQSWRQIK